MPNKEIDDLRRKQNRLYAELKTENDALSRLEAERQIKSLTPTQEEVRKLASNQKVQIEKEIQVVEVNLAESRITDLVAESAPNAVVKWDRDKVPSFVRMRATDSVTGATLINSSGDVHVSEIVDKSDAEIRQLLKAWSDGKI